MSYPHVTQFETLDRRGRLNAGAGGHWPSLALPRHVRVRRTAVPFPRLRRRSRCAAEAI